MNRMNYYKPLTKTHIATNKKFKPAFKKQTFMNLKQTNDEEDSTSQKRYSYGIACFRYHNKQYEVLLVKRRFTYAFCDFINGNYSKKDNKSIMKLLDNMTTDEKADIAMLNFDILWARVWKDKKVDSKKFKIFTENFLKDKGVRLLKLLRESKSIDHIWELPKGQKDKHENELQCAIREFREETSLSKSRYTLFPNASRIYSYIDDGKTFVLKYYFAILNKNYNNIRINLYNDSSVLECKWVSMRDLQFLDKRLYKFCAPIRNYIKKISKVTSHV